MDETNQSNVLTPEQELELYGKALLQYSTLFHLAHINASKSSWHIVLEDLYGACADTGDAILEAFVEMRNGERMDYDMPDIAYASFVKGDITQIVKAIGGLREYGDSLAGVWSSNQAITTIVGDFNKSLIHFAYQLKSFTD